MGFFGMLFWILVLWFVIKWLRRSERCVAVGPGGYWTEGYGRDPYPKVESSRRAPRSSDRQEYIDSLESRISELEERLDFTERLLANRRESA
jgi:hypothetical protein